MLSVSKGSQRVVKITQAAQTQFIRRMNIHNALYLRAFSINPCAVWKWLKRLRCEYLCSVWNIDNALWILCSCGRWNIYNEIYTTFTRLKKSALKYSQRVMNIHAAYALCSCGMWNLHNALLTFWNRWHGIPTKNRLFKTVCVGLI
jgi:hypothetical protein